MIFAVLVVFLGVGLSLDPREVPSPLVGRPAPQFRLKELHHPDRLFGSSDLKGKVWDPERLGLLVRSLSHRTPDSERLEPQP